LKSQGGAREKKIKLQRAATRIDSIYNPPRFELQLELIRQTKINLPAD